MKVRCCIREADGANFGAYHPVTAAKPGIKVCEMEVPDPPQNETKEQYRDRLRREAEARPSETAAEVRDEFNQVVVSPVALLDEAGRPVVLSKSPAVFVQAPAVAAPGPQMPPGTEPVVAPRGFDPNATREQLFAYARDKFGKQFPPRWSKLRIVQELTHLEAQQP